MTPALAWALLVAYYLFSIHVYLAAHTLGTFKLSFGGVGGTELRLLLALVNGVAWIAPRLEGLGAQVLLFDLVGGIATLALAATLLQSAVSVSRRLARQEALR